MAEGVLLAPRGSHVKLFFHHVWLQRSWGWWLAGGPEVLVRSLGSWVGRNGEQNLMAYYWLVRGSKRERGWRGLPAEGQPPGSSLQSQWAIAVPGVHPGVSDLWGRVPGDLPSSVAVWDFKDCLSFIGRSWWLPLAVLSVDMGTAREAAWPGSSLINLLHNLGQVPSFPGASILPSVKSGDCI